MTQLSPVEVPEIPPIEFPWESPPPDPPQEPIKVLPIIVHGATYVWEDVYKFGSNLVDNILGITQNAAITTFQDVINLVKVGMSVEQTLWVNFVTMLERWTRDAVEHLTQAITDLGTWALSEFLRVYQELIDLSMTMVGFVLQQIGVVEQHIMMVEQNVITILEQTTINIENWVRTDIALPILQAISELGLKVETDLQRILVESEQFTVNMIDAKLAPILLLLVAMENQIRNLNAIDDECVEPMCQVMGPNTDVFKWLKLLGELLALLAGFEIASLTEQDLERLARVLTTGVATPAENLLTGFVEQGETVGGAAADIVGDIGNVGVDLLRELGIPV